MTILKNGVPKNIDHENWLSGDIAQNDWGEKLDNEELCKERSYHHIPLYIPNYNYMYIYLHFAAVAFPQHIFLWENSR